MDETYDPQYEGEAVQASNYAEHIEKYPYPCEVCGKENTVAEPKYCCHGYDCGCMGMPIDPPVCSNECFDKLMNNQHE